MTDISLIVAIFQLAQIMFAPFVSKIKNALGTKNAIISGFLLEALCLAGLGACGYFDDVFYFKWISVVLRFVQGFGDVVMQVACYGLVCLTFSDEISKYCAFVEMSVGLGLAVGPFLGSIIYAQL